MLIICAHLLCWSHCAVAEIMMLNVRHCAVAEIMMLYVRHCAVAEIMMLNVRHCAVAEIMMLNMNLDAVHMKPLTVRFSEQMQCPRNSTIKETHTKGIYRL